MTTERARLIFSTREEEQMRRLELKWKIAKKTEDKTEAERLTKQLVEMEEFAKWRADEIRKSGVEVIKGSDLKLYTITKWRRMAKGDMIIERKSIREEIEEEIRRWRETELQLDV